MVIRNISIEELERRVKSLTENATESEMLFRNRLDDLGVSYEFQWAIESKTSYYIADFFIPRSKTIIEIDGYYHYTKIGKKRDVLRDAFLKKHGYRVIHIPNKDVLTFDIDSICKIKTPAKKLKKKKPIIKKTTMSYVDKMMMQVKKDEKAEALKNKRLSKMKMLYPNIFL